MLDRPQWRRKDNAWKNVQWLFWEKNDTKLCDDAPGCFEGQAFENSITISAESEELVLGDIVLCSEVIQEQAKEFGHSQLREFSYLIVHSMLHLFGYDHMEEEEREQMETLQREIMDQMGISR